ncbi:MAG: DUF4419 domain-containing protein [Limnospira sp.]
MITLPVDAVSKATGQIASTTTPKRAIKHWLNIAVESCSELDGEVISCSYHPFVNACHKAYSQHYPLLLSPDMFWLLFTQGLAHHIHLNSEEMRHFFADQKTGKRLIQVRRDDFVKGSPENPWEEVFSEFSEQIKTLIGEDNHRHIVAEFSTTGNIERAAGEIVLMDALQSYFDYSLMTMCGIPEITLEGEVADWESLRERVAATGEVYGLQWWTRHLLPVLDRIVKTAKGLDESLLWRNLYKIEDGSGGPFISGWIVQWFPYLRNHDDSIYKNQSFEVEGTPIAGLKDITLSGSLTHSQFPSGLSVAPFEWLYYSRQYDMEFIAGFTSYTQDQNTLALRPKIGWAVREKPTFANTPICL